MSLATPMHNDGLELNAVRRDILAKGLGLTVRECESTDVHDFCDGINGTDDMRVYICRELSTGLYLVVIRQRSVSG